MLFRSKALTATTTTMDPADFTMSKSVTFFAIHLGKGDEIADYSISYNTANTETKSMSKMYYEGNLTASAMTASDTDKAMIKTETFKKALTATTTTIDPADFTRSKSVTFFAIHLGKGYLIALTQVYGKERD